MTGIKTLRNAYLNEGFSASKSHAPVAAATTAVMPDPSAIGNIGQTDLDLQNGESSLTSKPITSSF